MPRRDRAGRSESLSRSGSQKTGRLGSDRFGTGGGFGSSRFVEGNQGGLRSSGSPSHQTVPLVLHADLRQAFRRADEARPEPRVNWAPFQVAPQGTRPDPIRSIDSPEGIGDRMRTAAFAEIQAREAFEWAARTFEETPTDLRRAWQALAAAEHRHLNWLLRRMDELQIDVGARKVSDQLWQSFQSCKTAKDFAIYMASAEERGRKAGERFHEALQQKDPISAEIFRKIAEEEIAHIALALKHFPETAQRLQ